MQSSVEDFYNHSRTQHISVFWNRKRIHSTVLDLGTSYSDCHVQRCHRIWQNLIEFSHLGIDVGLNLIVDLIQNQRLDGIKDEGANRIDDSL